MKVHAGVVNQDVEICDALDGSLNLLRVDHVQDYGCDALIRMDEGLARTGIHAPLLNASSTSPRPHAAIGPSDQDSFVLPRVSRLAVRVRVKRSNNARRRG
jgi:hypothetical protein